MAAIRNPWQNSRMTGSEKYARQIERLEADIAHAQRVLAWQIAEGNDTGTAISRKTIAKLQARLAKLV